MKEFKNKVAVITGAASGIGLGIAKRAVREGMKVVIADIEETALASAEEILQKLGDNVVTVPTDVSKAIDLEKLAQKTIDAYGEIDLLVNNAGVVLLNRLTWEHTLSDWKWLMDVNMWGVINGIHTFIPIMLKQDKECHIVNTSSLAGLVIIPFQSVYNVTKHGIVALSETLSYELKELNSKIKVSVFCPGAVPSNILTGDRNRPTELRNNELEIDFRSRREKILSDHPEFKFKVSKIAEAINTSAISAEKAGDIVFEGIKDNTFYILTDKEPFWRNMIKERIDGMFQAFKKKR